MNSNITINEKILTDARVKADLIVQEAENKIKHMEDRLQEEFKKTLNDALKELESQKPLILKRKLTVGELESKKMVLKAKMSVIDQAFTIALDKLNSLDKDKYLSIISGMLKAHAIEGDSITISKYDKDLITDKFIDDFNKKNKLNLTINKDMGDFKGGIIINSRNMDKNLLFKVELDTLRESIETEIAALIFKNSN